MPARIKPKRHARLYLAEWREARGMTQQAVADALETSDVTISRWETNARYPDFNAQAALAEVYAIDVMDLRRHPSVESADALLRGQRPEIVAQAMKLIKALRE
jgi:transcriptional regulator with XRE-family HTH domain